MQAIAGSSSASKPSSLARNNVHTDAAAPAPQRDNAGGEANVQARDLIMDDRPWPEKLAGSLKQFTYSVAGRCPKTIEELNKGHLRPPDDFKRFTDLLARTEAMCWESLGTVYEPLNVPGDQAPLPPAPAASAIEALRFLAPVRNALNDTLSHVNENRYGQTYALVRPKLQDCYITYPSTENGGPVPIDLGHYVLERVHFRNAPPEERAHASLCNAITIDCRFFPPERQYFDYCSALWKAVRIREAQLDRELQ